MAKKKSKKDAEADNSTDLNKNQTEEVSLDDQIKEEKNTLTEKEIYLLQQLAKKK